MDPPGGVEVKDDLYFNPYFPGQSIAMAPALYNEIIEYEDGKQKLFLPCKASTKLCYVKFWYFRETQIIKDLDIKKNDWASWPVCHRQDFLFSNLKELCHEIQPN